MFARFQIYVYICTKNLTPSRRNYAQIVGRCVDLREKKDV